MINTKDLIIETGESGLNLLGAFKYILKGKFAISDVALQIEKAGVGSLFIVIITSIFIGLAMSAQLAKELSEKFGAEHVIGGLIGMAIVRELAPIVTAIVVAGRVGAAIAAEIGSMKSSEQVDALVVLGVDPIKFLLVPRLLAAALVSPLLTVVSAICSIVAGMLLSRHMVNLSHSVYMDSLRNFVETKDVVVMMVKALTFGIIISIIATTRGLQVSGGAEAVGDSATKTVVSSIILIFIFNYLITSIFYGG